MLASDVIARVTRQFGDEVQAQIKQSDIFMWINDAQRELNEKNNILRKIGTAAGVAQQNEYIMPADLQHLDRVAYQGSALKGVSLQQIDEILPLHDQTIAQGYPVGLPNFYWIYADNIFFYPAPQSSGAADLTIYYLRKPTDVTATGSSIDLPDEYCNRVVEYCLAKAYELDTNYIASQMKMQEFQQNTNTMNGRRDWSPEDAYPNVTYVNEYDGVGYY